MEDVPITMGRWTISLNFDTFLSNSIVQDIVSLRFDIELLEIRKLYLFYYQFLDMQDHYARIDMAGGIRIL